MDDRNLIAVAEQAAGTSKVLRSPIAGCTVRGPGAVVFRGCRLEFDDPSLDLDPVANALAAARVEGMVQVERVGFYSPTGGALPTIPRATLLRLKEVAVSDDLVVIFSPGPGERVERTLLELLAEA